MSGAIVQGSIHCTVDDSSDDDEDQHDPSYPQPLNMKDYANDEDEEEEIERFGGDNHHARVNKQADIINKPAEEPKKMSLIEAMASSVAQVERSQLDNHENANPFGETETILHDKNSANKAAVDKPTDSTPAEGDYFGIAYKPFKKQEEQYAGPNAIRFEDDPDVKESLAILKAKPIISSSAAPNDDDNEFDFDVASSVDESSKTALETALNQAALRCVDDDVLETINAADDDHLMIPATDMIDDDDDGEKIDYRSSAQAAFNELKSIYGSGLGDIEVRLLDSNTSSSSHDHHMHGKDIISSPSTVHKSLMKDVIEEGDEEAEMEDEIREVESLQLMFNAQQQLEQEWDTLNSSSQHHPITISSSHDSMMMTYDDITSYFNSTTVDLSKYKPMIVTVESSSSSWLTGPAKLKYPGCDRQLDFPFLLAQVDYDPACAEHLSCLRRIYHRLIHPIASDDHHMISCPAYGPHWEKIGFQGLDPVTDLNRSMKMLAVIQALHMVDHDHAFSIALHQLSGSDHSSSSFSSSLSSHKSDKRTSVVDKSWPYMCVSVMFTREALQALRRGDLNKKCNKRQDVMSVIHDFHHACFYDFAKRLFAAPNKHHAEVLKDLREYCQANPLQLLRNYRNAVKARHDASDSLIGSYDHIQAYIMHQSESSSGHNKAPTAAVAKNTKSDNDDKVAHFDDLEAVEDANASMHATSSTNEMFWSSLALGTSGTRANKFKA